MIFSHWRIRFYSTLAFFCSLTNGVARRPCTFSLCLYWTGSHKTFTMQSVPAASKFSCFSLFFWRTPSQGRQFSPKFRRVPFPPSPILTSLPFFPFSHLPSPHLLQNSARESGWWVFISDPGQNVAGRQRLILKCILGWEILPGDCLHSVTNFLAWQFGRVQ